MCVNPKVFLSSAAFMSSGVFKTVAIVRGYLRLVGFLLLFVLFCLGVFPMYFFFLLEPDLTRTVLIKVTCGFVKVCNFLIGLRVQVEGKEHIGNENYLIVSNHLSYLDVLALMSHLPSCFITSVEVKNTPFLGAIAKLGGCLFVERRDRSHLKNEIKEIASVLTSDLNVVLYAEGTSTNGDAVKRFKRPLFCGAIAAGKGVLPVSINYISFDGAPVTVVNRDRVCWHGRMTFFPHLISFLKASETVVRMSFHAPFYPDESQSVDEVAARAYATVAGGFRSFVCRVN